MAHVGEEGTLGPRRRFRRVLGRAHGIGGGPLGLAIGVERARQLADLRIAADIGEAGLSFVLPQAMQTAGERTDRRDHLAAVEVQQGEQDHRQAEEVDAQLGDFVSPSFRRQPPIPFGEAGLDGALRPGDGSEDRCLGVTIAFTVDECDRPAGIAAPRRGGRLVLQADQRVRVALAGLEQGQFLDGEAERAQLVEGLVARAGHRQFGLESLPVARLGGGGIAANRGRERIAAMDELVGGAQQHAPLLGGGMPLGHLAPLDDRDTDAEERQHHDG